MPDRAYQIEPAVMQQVRIQIGFAYRFQQISPRCRCRPVQFRTLPLMLPGVGQNELPLVMPCSRMVLPMRLQTQFLTPVLSFTAGGPDSGTSIFSAPWRIGVPRHRDRAVNGPRAGIHARRMPECCRIRTAFFRPGISQSSAEQLMRWGGNVRYQ